MNIKEQAKKMKLESARVANLNSELRNKILENIHISLDRYKDDIFKANKLDLEKAKENNIKDSIYKRLKFDESKLEAVINGIKDLIKLDDPLGKLQIYRELDTGLVLRRETCPIGLIGVVFEARPDALIQIACLCIKSGNLAILKGGSETANSNKTIFDILKRSIEESGIKENLLFLVEDREDINTLLSCHDSVDLLIPRGSNEFVSYIMSNTKIPVMGHADGICHIYVDKEVDIDMAVDILVDSKTQYVSACNTVETLLVHENIAAKFLPELKLAFDKAGVIIKGDTRTLDIIDCEPATDKDFDTEYLDLIISIKIVNTIDEAIEHINKHGSHHTDCIITSINENADYFQTYVDSAGVYHNISTRFADGFRYGFGAEVGISTSKLHARGPVGLEGLCTYKYKLSGNGHIVDTYARGEKKFHFKDI